MVFMLMIVLAKVFEKVCAEMRGDGVTRIAFSVWDIRTLHPLALVWLTSGTRRYVIAENVVLQVEFV
jgi:hypothetical protein